MPCYSPQELMAEKGRAILTRVDYKLRDTLDIIMLSRDLGMDLYDYEDAIKEKTRFTVDRFERYMHCLLDRKIPTIDELADGEFGLFINKPPPSLRDDVARINEHMGQLREELLREYGQSP